MKLLMILLSVVGIISFVYYGIIVLYAGIDSEFAWFWPMVGIGCFILIFLLWLQKTHKLQVPWIINGMLGVIILIGLIVVVVTEVLIIGYANKKPEDNASYMIVLGAKVRGTAVTNSLKKRLDKAIEYKKRNHLTKIIVSGGQGPGEDITEAKAMEQYLLSKGIPLSEIIKEDKSTNTNENIILSKEIIEQLSSKNGKKIDNENILIVTNGFHIYRAIQIAKKQEITNVEGLAAPTDNILRVNYYIREVFAIIKDRLVGNIS